MPDMREGGLGTAACYLTVERLALQAGVESPFWDETSLLMGGCEEPWYKKPLTPRRLRSFLKRYGGSPILGDIIRHRSSWTWVTFKTPQERFCGVVFLTEPRIRTVGRQGERREG